jgi:energy-coupling factor transporter ATP-binding protein EcfA2
MGKLNFTSIMVRKAPGFRNGLRVDGLDKLSPDINIIAGPNGSGKSTLARIIQRLLWPEREKGLDIEGAYEMEGYPWMVRLDSSALNIQKNGIDTLPAGIPSEDMKKVYMLALHDLITENDEDLARKILETSIGGFDLDKAKDNLKYSRDIKNRRAEAYIRYKTANEKSNEIIRKQSELKEQEGSLLQLEAEKNEAMFAVGLKDLYEKAEAYLLAKQELNRAEAALCVYPEVLNEAAGNEFEQIKQLEEDIAREETDIGNYNNEIAEKEETINGLAGPKEGIDDSVISELKLRINNISELEKRISECNLRIKKLEVQAEEAKKNIGGIQDHEKWAGITLESLGNLDQFFQEALTVMQQKISVVAEIQRLRQEAIEFTHIAEKLRKGISILGDWLKEQKLMKGIPTWITILISCLGILTSVAIWLAGPVGLSGIGLIVILLLYAFLAGRSDRSDSKLIYRQDDYKTTGLPEPEKWYAADVTARLQELINALHDEAQAEAREKIKQTKKPWKDSKPEKKK